MFTTSNEAEALDYERELIAQYGRENLTNLTDGGEGVSGMKHTEEARRKIGEGARGRPSPKSEEQRRKIAATLKGRPLAPHVHEAFVKVNIGRKYSQEHRTNISMGQTGGRLYVFIAPDGTRYEGVGNLEQFARDHGVMGDGLLRCATGKRKQYRGWIGWIEGEDPRAIPHRTAYTIIAPDGARYQHITNPAAFAREHTLDGHGLRAMLRGKNKHYTGWTGWAEGNEPLTKFTRPTCTLIDPNGAVYRGITHPGVFAQEHGLCESSIRRVLAGTYHDHKGWTGFREMSP